MSDNRKAMLMLALEWLAEGIMVVGIVALAIGAKCLLDPE